MGFGKTFVQRGAKRQFLRPTQTVPLNGGVIDSDISKLVKESKPCQINQFFSRKQKSFV